MEMVSKVNLRRSGHFRTIWDNWRLFWGYFWSFLGQNLKLRQTSHVTIQNDRKRSKIPMEIVSEVNLMMLRSSQDHLGPFEAILGLFLGLNLKLRQTSHVTTQNDRKRSTIPIKRVSEVNLKTLRSFRHHWDDQVISGPFGTI